jgi:hypothetical protein
MESHCTVNVAALLVTAPKELLAVAWNSAWLSVFAVVKEYVEDTAPPTAFQVLPESLLRFQVKVGEGFPLAATVKLAMLLELTV